MEALRQLLAASLVVLAVLAAASRASADSPDPGISAEAVDASIDPGSNPTAALLGTLPGFDVSWPQCGKAMPPGPIAFAIVGINNGKPYTANPCFMEQYRWAQRIEKNPAVYVNTAFPKAGAVEATSGPYGSCPDENDGWCRGYNYGYGLAKEVVTRANLMRVHPPIYWLDVETGNYWSSDVQANSQVLRGAIAYFKEHSLAVGMYGTPYQYRLIAGTWQSPGIPIWTAGAQGMEGASARCNSGYAFAGGNVVMVQYYDWGFDTNYICPGTETLFTHPELQLSAAPGPWGRGNAVTQQLPFWRVLPFVTN